MSNLQTYYPFRLDIRKVDQHTGPTFIKPDKLDPWIKDQIESLSCQQFRPYSYQILCHMGGTSPPTWHKIS